MTAAVLAAGAALASCGSSSAQESKPVDGGEDPLPDPPTCTAVGDGAEAAAPELLLELWEEVPDSAWLGAPVIADLHGDGARRILAARGNRVVTWNADGSIAWVFDGAAETASRIWSSPVVADFRGDLALEIAIAAGDSIWMLDADGQPLSGFPVSWRYELRSLAAGDVNGDGQLDLVAATTDNAPDVIIAYTAGGDLIPGFPPVQAGVVGCEIDVNCWTAGAYDQNVAIGDLDGDAQQDIVSPHDNAYAGFYRGNGELFDANAIFVDRPKVLGVRYLHDLAQAAQGYAEDESTALQAHFTNTAPAIADIDEDGAYEVILLGSVQNASQENRELGVGLWVLLPDASRLDGWESPFHAPDYLAGLWDYEGTNVVAATNQVSVADIDGDTPGKEMVFAGFDGVVHAVSAAREPLWSFTYTTDDRVLTGGVAIGDLSNDGHPEIVFATYSPDNDKSALFILDATGELLHQLPLPRMGAMSVPTLGDLDGNETIEIAVSLRDVPWDSGEASVLVYTVPNSSENCLLWPTARANYLRNGWVRNSEQE